MGVITNTVGAEAKTANNEDSDLLSSISNALEGFFQRKDLGLLIAESKVSHDRESET